MSAADGPKYELNVYVDGSIRVRGKFIVIAAECCHYDE